jgi:hypothetical protein
MDIQHYRKLVERLAFECKGESVYNGSADHAAVIVENLFATADCHIRLLTGDLDAKVYGAEPVVRRAKQFLGHSDHRLDILVEDVTFNHSHPLIEEIIDDENVSIFQVPPSLQDQVNFHCMITDAKSFRFEGEKGSHVAVAGFGDQETADHLTSVFDRLKSQCVKIDKSALRADLT